MNVLFIYIGIFIKAHVVKAVHAGSVTHCPVIWHSKTSHASYTKAVFISQNSRKCPCPAMEETRTGLLYYIHLHEQEHYD